MIFDSFLASRIVSMKTCKIRRNQLEERQRGGQHSHSAPGAPNFWSTQLLVKSESSIGIIQLLGYPTPDLF